MFIPKEITLSSVLKKVFEIIIKNKQITKNKIIAGLKNKQKKINKMNKKC